MRTCILTYAVAFLATALTGGCGSGAGDTPLPMQVTTALETALTLNDPESCRRIFAEDAQIIPEDEPVVAGIDAIVAYCRNAASPELTFNTNRTLSLRRGDLAIEQGTYRVRNVQRGTDVEQGQFLTVWRRIDGEWRMYRTIFNTEVAPRGGTTVTPEEPGVTE